jgi:hypothetical protein
MHKKADESKNEESSSSSFRGIQKKETRNEASHTTLCCLRIRSRPSVLKTNIVDSNNDVKAQRNSQTELATAFLSKLINTYTFTYRSRGPSGSRTLHVAYILTCLGIILS